MNTVHENQGPGISLLVLGGTGAVGRELVKTSLDHPSISKVIAPTRRALSPHAKLINPVFTSDLFSIPPDAWLVDAVVCGFGTTIRKAGSREAFATIDHDMPLDAARRAREAGARAFGLVSSVGAQTGGSFYLKSKLRLENSIRALGYPSYAIVRPSLIETDRDEFRPAEALGRLLAPILNTLLPLQYRSVSAHRIANALLGAVVRGTPGETIIESADLHKEGAY